MKKSEIYKKAQIAVLFSDALPDEKLEILRELISHEDLALFTEKKEDSGNGN